jgi:hypothetical protein
VTMPPEVHRALFIDLLGFEALVERYPDAVDEVLNDVNGWGWTQLGANGSAKHYSQFFARTLEHHLRSERREGALRALIFSDCAFLMLGGAVRSAQFASRLMRDCILGHTPVRMAIASGSFNHVVTAIEESDGSTISRALFTGTSITRAARMEGIEAYKGMRIFIHPSTPRYDVEAIRAERPVIPLSESGGDGWEVDYLYDSTAEEGAGAESKDAALFRAVAEMREPSMTPRVLRHYSETVDALNKMRVARRRHIIDVPPLAPAEGRG